VGARESNHRRRRKRPQATPMNTKRRLARRVWRLLTRSLPAHVALALAVGLGCGVAAARYHTVISPPYAAILGALVAYPALVVAWRRLPRPGRNGRRRSGR
jgi:hypothetical protein